MCFNVNQPATTPNYQPSLISVSVEDLKLSEIAEGMFENVAVIQERGDGACSRLDALLEWRKTANKVMPDSGATDKKLTGHIHKLAAPI